MSKRRMAGKESTEVAGLIMAGLDPAIYGLFAGRHESKDLDARDIQHEDALRAFARA